MTALIDSGFLYATLDQGDKNHQRVVKLLPNLPDNLLLPTTVLVEVAYLLQARLGHPAMRRFVQELEHGPIQIEAIDKTDLARIHVLLNQYADTEVDFVDASLVTIAERLNIHRILTVDRRDFALIRPAHCDYFEILP
jgi:predicted nucleic acid-binding protein